uniref:ZP domain-containing protein n=1 Tax=Esox lucius TaxID=8010 RepID=A0AAY5KC67_ESOLU
MTVNCKMKVTLLKVLLGILLLCVTVNHTIPLAPVGTFQTECHERHFWLVVKSGFLSPMVRIEVEDHRGVHFLSGQRAAECGYTVFFNHRGDLVFRASFLACHVDNQGDSEVRLRGWLVTKQLEGKDLAYPFLLQCSPHWPWASREMVCEENYMEVSVKRPLPAPLGSDVVRSGVMFHGPGLHTEESRPRPVTEAGALGYHVSVSSSRIVMRCPYSSPFSFTLKVRSCCYLDRGFVPPPPRVRVDRDPQYSACRCNRRTQDTGVELEVVNATVLYPHQGQTLAISFTAACPLNEATAEGARLLWSAPHVLTPLVRERPRNWGMRMGVETLVLGECAVKDRGYQLRLSDGLMEVSVPFGAEGTHIKSGVLDGRYSQSASMDLFYMHQWEEERWPLTQHRSFRLLKTPYVPRNPTLTDNTSPSQEVFWVTLGAFPLDVSLHNVTVGGQGDPLPWDQVLNPNRTHSYQLHVPFSHPLVLQEFGEGGYRKYSLSLTFALSISPPGEVFYHNATIVSDVHEPTATLPTPIPAPPRLEGRCMENGFLVLLHYGAQGRSWELFLGARQLDWELVKTGGFKVETEEEYFSVRIPLFSPGIIFQELSLQGLVAQVEVSVVDINTLKVEDRVIQNCIFHVRELQVCLPDKRMLIVTDTSRTVPPTQSIRTSLLDPSCVPRETDGVRALFNFSLDSCGTTETVMGDLVVYENRVLYLQEPLSGDHPLVHSDWLTIQCRYPKSDPGTVFSAQPVNSTFDLSPLPPLKHTRREASGRGVGLYVAVVGVAVILVGTLIALKMRL